MTSPDRKKDRLWKTGFFEQMLNKNCAIVNYNFSSSARLVQETFYFLKNSG